MGVRAVSLKEAAKLTGLSYRTMLSASKRGDLAAFLPPGVTRKRFVRVDELERWMRSMEKREAPRTA